MQIWSARAGSVHFRSPVTFDTPWSPAQQVGILASDSDGSLVNLCRIQANLCVQCRHPAKVGLGRWQAQGAPGQQYCWAFIHAIEVAAIAQPVVIAAECSDEIAEHPLLKSLRHCSKHLDFVGLGRRSHRTRIWLTIPGHHGCPRGRGLMFRPNQLDFLLHSKLLRRLGMTLRTTSAFRRVNQLVLSESEKVIYDDPTLLPGDKRKRDEGDINVRNHILWARVPKGHEPLPTLCVSYSS